MKRRFVITMLTLVAFILATSAPLALADGYKKCGSKKSGLEEKFSSKVKMILSNETELGLNEGQIKKIKDLKVSTKKSVIRADAEIDVLALDIKMAMWEDPIDTASVDKLIDKKYDLKKEKTKTLVGAYASLKEILTKDQKAKMKEIYKAQKKECDMMKDKVHGKMTSGKR